MDVEQVDFDIEGGRILFNAFAAGGVRPVESGLYLYDTGKKKLELLWDRRFRIGPIKLTGEHTAVFAGVDLEQQSRNDNPRLYRFDLHRGLCTEFGSFADRSFEHPATATDDYFSGPAAMKTRDGYLYFRQVERDREVLRRMAPDGECETMFDGMKLLGGFEVLDGALLMIGLAGMKLSELYLFRDGVLRRLTGHNAAFAGKRFSEPEKVIERIEGTEIDGYVFSPAEFREGERYPAVLIIHGGPKMIYTGAWAHDIQLLCARGYYVLCANPSGSDGRGNEFLDIRGSFAELPYRQLIAFTERVVARYPGIDRERLGVTGGSYGGYMTNYIISRTGLFKAAVSERSISSIVTAFTSSDIGYQFIYEYMGNRGAPWQSPGEALDASPIFRAAGVSTPTLFIHGTNDNRCHYSESLNMYGALKYHGVESRICLFEGENHSLPVRGRPKNRLRRYMEMLDWFDGHLKTAAKQERL
jgi:dipeptidyl aminopeptidase/acylaminoacyl peptidase